MSLTLILKNLSEEVCLELGLEQRGLSTTSEIQRKVVPQGWCMLRELALTQLGLRHRGTSQEILVFGSSKGAHSRVIYTDE